MGTGLCSGSDRNSGKVLPLLLINFYAIWQTVLSKVTSSSNVVWIHNLPISGSMSSPVSNFIHSLNPWLVLRHRLRVTTKFRQRLRHGLGSRLGLGLRDNTVDLAWTQDYTWSQALIHILALTLAWSQILALSLAWTMAQTLEWLHLASQPGGETLAHRTSSQTISGTGKWGVAGYLCHQSTGYTRTGKLSKQEHEQTPFQTKNANHTHKNSLMLHKCPIGSATLSL